MQKAPDAIIETPHYVQTDICEHYQKILSYRRKLDIKPQKSISYGNLLSKIQSDKNEQNKSVF